MREPTSIYAVRRRAVRLWLLAVAVLIFAMVLVGGATRLTESGLSITEWHPISGTMPPLSQADWNAEFDGYKAIPQYKLLNRDMTLDEFKSIFWWEWTHRQLGRVIGAAFLLPFLWFLWRGWIEPGMRGPLSAIFGLGAFQGGVGWWMVASGLAGRTEVSQYRLAFHLTLACLIYVAILWAGERFAERRAPAVPVRLRVGAVVLLVLVLAQIYLGALTAGLRAGYAYNTWPLIDGAFIPDAARLFFNQPLWRNFFENTLTVQFDHRMMAYTVLVVALLHAFDALRARPSGAAATGAVVLALAVTLQAMLGILTLLHRVPIGLGLAHQGMAMVVLTLASLHAARLARPAWEGPPVHAPGIVKTSEYVKTAE
ncbi:MAG TPA: COX15/CtaA family protein [Xanthobacteraceae bacterium]|jgi:cytochrome c oxidase assembly protein subunit 15